MTVRAFSHTFAIKNHQIPCLRHQRSARRYTTINDAIAVKRPSFMTIGCRLCKRTQSIVHAVAHDVTCGILAKTHPSVADEILNRWRACSFRRSLLSVPPAKALLAFVQVRLNPCQSPRKRYSRTSLGQSQIISLTVKYRTFGPANTVTSLFWAF